MDNGGRYPNWNYGQPFAGHFPTFPSYNDGSVTVYTGINTANPLDFSEYIPDCSSEGTGPWVAVEVSTPNWLLPNIFGAGWNIAQVITKKLPHIRISMNGNYNIDIDGPLQQVYMAKEFFQHYTTIMNLTTVVDDVPVHRSVHPRERVERFAVPPTEVSDDFETESHCEVVHVDKKFMRHVVGHRGVTIRMIEIRTHTEIKAPGESSDKNYLLVFGKRENAKKARRFIADIERTTKTVYDRLSKPVSEGSTDDLEDRQVEKELSRHRETVDVDLKVLPKVIGARCAAIAKLAEKHDVLIELPPRRGRDRRRMERLTIFGSESKVKAAKDELHEIIKDKETYINEWLLIDPRVQGRLIGSKGRRINELVAQLDVRIQFPKPAFPEKRVKIYGRKDDVRKAKLQLLSMQSLLMELDTANHRTVSKVFSRRMYFKDLPNQS